MERHCKASNDGLLRKRKLFYHLKSPQFLFHEDTVRNGHQFSGRKRRLKGMVLRMRPQNRGPVLQQVWHYDDFTAPHRRLRHVHLGPVFRKLVRFNTLVKLTMCYDLS